MAVLMVLLFVGLLMLVMGKDQSVMKEFCRMESNNRRKPCCRAY